MKHSMIKMISLLLAVFLSLAVFSACGVDPNVKQKEETASEYEVKIDGEEEEVEREGFYAYGKGKTDPVEVGGVEVSVTDFAVRSYELAFLMAQKNFKTPKDIPLDAAVQYAFTHIFYNDFYHITNKAAQYRSASEQQIRDSLKEQFGTDDFKVTSSMLYNPGKEIFEMWIPSYGTNIYYIIDAVNVDGDQAEIVSTFYNELARKTLLGKATITVKIQDGRPVIASLKAE